MKFLLKIFLCFFSDFARFATMIIISLRDSTRYRHSHAMLRRRGAICRHDLVKADTVSSGDARERPPESVGIWQSMTTPSSSTLHLRLVCGGPRYPRPQRLYLFLSLVHRRHCRRLLFSRTRGSLARVSAREREGGSGEKGRRRF